MSDRGRELEEQGVEADLDLAVLRLETDPEQVAAIMRALPDAPDAAPFWRWLIRPVRMPAWTVALLLVGLGTAVVLASSRPPAPGPASAPALAKKVEPAPTPAPEPAACPVPKVLVRFVIKAPKASDVHLVGDFNDWSVQATPLSDPDENGNWTVTVPLKSGRYQYKYLLNGEEWVEEPDAPAYQADGFGGKNSLLVI